MSISVGELALGVTVTGYAAALAAIEKLDAAAAQAGARKIDVNAGGAGGVAAATRELQTLNTAARTSSTQITASLRQTVAAVAAAAKAEVGAVAQAAKASETAVASSLRGSLANANRTSLLMSRLAANAGQAGTRGTGRGEGDVRDAATRRAAEIARLRGGGATASGGVLSGAAGLASSALGGLGITLGVGAAVGAFASTVSSAIEASGRFNVSLRVLDATSRSTGVPLSLLQRTSADLQRSLGLTATSANTMTATAIRFTAAAGRANETGRFLTQWLALAQSRGLSTADAMQALETTLQGQDEGLNRIGLRNPGEIYKAWGAGADTASRMSAIVNEVNKEGAVVADMLATSLTAAEKEQRALTAAKENFLVALGQAITSGTGYTSILGAMSGGLAGATTWVGAHRNEIALWMVDIGRATGALTTLVGWIATLSSAIMKLPQFRLASGLLGAIGRLGGGSDTSALDSDPALAALTGGGASPERIAEAAAERARLAMEAAAAAGEKARKKAEADARRAAAAAARRDAAPVNLVNAPAGFGGLSNIGSGPGMTTRDVRLGIRPRIELVGFAQEAAKATRQMGSIIASGMGQGLSSAVQAGVTAAFNGGGITGVIKAFGATMLSAVGGIFVQLGETYLMYGGIMAALASLLPNPFTAGAAGLAIGAALIAMGSALSAVASGGGKKSAPGGGGSFGATGSADMTSSVILGPRAAPVGGRQAPTGRSTALDTPAPFVFAPTIIGQNDPRAQRDIANMAYQGYRRSINANRKG